MGAPDDTALSQRRLWRVSLEVCSPEPPRTVVLERRTGEPITIGRARCDVTVPIGALARHHATVSVLDGGQVALEASGSGGGCWLAGKRVKRAVLAPGAKVYLGQACVRLVAAPEPLGGDGP